MLYLYYFLYIFSILGYGYLTFHILKIKLINVGLIGILGISFLILISFFTSIFIPHDYFFNSLILIVGLILFFKFIKKYQIKKIEFYIIFLIFTLLLIFILVGKNHDDYPYYHFPYTYLLTQESHPLGLGQLNNGFRNPSSLFFFNSLFFLPITSIYLLNIGSVYFLGFTNIFLIKNIFDKKFFKKYRFYNYISLIFFIFINTLFVRLAEYGTDRGGQILLIVIFIIFTLIINQKNSKYISENFDYTKYLFILASLTISLKPFYLIYIPLILIILFYKHLRVFLLKTIKSRVFIFAFIFLSFSFIYTFFNSSCLIFPASFTCFENLPWSIGMDQIEDVKIWYELWSKSGASPNYIVEDRLNYIENLNWLNNWLDKYFFNKVLDYILSLIFISLIIFLTFKKKLLQPQKKRQFIYLYIFLIFCLIEWFFNHPALRYGGYHLIALIMFIPLSFQLEKYYIDWRTFLKKSFILLTITIIIFVSRNLLRLEKEFKVYNYNILKNNNYLFIGGDKDFYFRYDKELKDKKFRHHYKKIFGKKFLIIEN